MDFRVKLLYINAVCSTNDIPFTLIVKKKKYKF